MKQHEIKKAETDFKILELIESRWSPVVFMDKPIDKEDVNKIFEAARWAPSSRNEQPWRYIYAHRGEKDFDKILETLMPGNQVWAKDAAVLIISLAEKFSSHNSQQMRHYMYDTGAANALMQIQALSSGIYSHTMGGFSIEKVKENFSFPDSVEPLTVIALGYLGNLDAASQDLKDRDLSKRDRLPIDKIILK